MVTGLDVLCAEHWDLQGEGRECSAQLQEPDSWAGAAVEQPQPRAFLLVGYRLEPRKIHPVPTYLGATDEPQWPMTGRTRDMSPG